MVSYQLYYSDRKIPLVYVGPVLSVPVLTVENYCKWYNLHLVDSIIPGLVIPVPFPDDGPWCKAGESPYLDHVPNPVVVQRFAEAKDYHLDDQSLEMIIGRWELEYHHHYEF